MARHIIFICLIPVVSQILANDILDRYIHSDLHCLFVYRRKFCSLRSATLPYVIFSFTPISNAILGGGDGSFILSYSFRIAKNRLNLVDIDEDIMAYFVILRERLEVASVG